MLDKEAGRSLHRYLIWSLHLRDRFHECLEKQGSPPDGPSEALNRWAIRPFMWLTLWYAMIYVVIEGYRQMGLRDQAIDDLLSNDAYLTILRRHRNGAFHFQPKYFDPRFTNMLLNEEVRRWAEDLQTEFSRLYFAFFELQGRYDIEIDDDDDQDDEEEG